MLTYFKMPVEGIYALIITTCPELYRKMLDMYALKSLDFALILLFFAVDIQKVQMRAA